MTANPTHAELVEVLRAGVRHAGEAATDDGLIELFDIEGADEIMNEAADALEEADTLRAENARLREALTPSAGTKAAYIGEWHEEVELYNPAHEDDEDEPETISHHVPVSWTTIKSIMAAIRARAALNPERAEK